MISDNRLHRSCTCIAICTASAITMELRRCSSLGLPLMHGAESAGPTTGIADLRSTLAVQLAVETVYLEVTLQLVSKTSSSLSSSQAKALEDLVFDWVLHAEKFVDSRFLDLMKARATVRLPRL